MGANQISRTFSAATLGERMARGVGLIVLYTVVLTACRYFAYEVRFDFVVPPEFQDERLRSMVLNLSTKLLCLLLFRQFGSLLTYFSVPDLIRIAVAMATANLVSYMLEFGY